MRVPQFLLLTLALPLSHAAETILGVYIVSRHGDRTAKSTPPANLTDLGYQEVFASGTYFRNRYISSNATSRIAGINSDIVKQSQITTSAPLDTVLMNSAQSFLQGLYPPVGSTLGSDTLRNGTTVQTPLNGYQLIPVQTVISGTGSEDSAWLQGSSNCAKALVSSNNYYTSSDYTTLLKTTADFYKSLSPMINQTFGLNDISFKNAYTSKLPHSSVFHLVHQANSLAHTSLGPPQRCLNPQHHNLLRLLRPLHPLHSPPSPRPRQHPRMEPRLQRLRPHPRHHRSHPRRPSPPSPQRHHYRCRQIKNKHPIRRLRRLPIFLWARPTGPGRCGLLQYP